MGPKYYLRRIIETGDTQRIPFERVHFAEAGVPPSIGAGMPRLEAYQLVNKWNISQGSQRFVYGLDC